MSTNSVTFDCMKDLGWNPLGHCPNTMQYVLVDLKV